MPAAYDTYDYPSYWLGRDYEHKSEVWAMQSLLSRIAKIKTILEVGSGFGRLTPSYAFRSKKVILTDPSSKLLKIARETFKNRKNFKFIHASLETLPEKIRSGSVDLVVLVRVIHHLQDLNSSFKIINRLLRPNGYFILEFANKANWKATIRHILSGDFTFPLDIFPTDLRSKKSIKKNSIPFFNYHPYKIKEMLKDNGFEIIEIKSVSNIRSSTLKSIFSTDILVSLEKLLQPLFTLFYFGPSIFILAQKRG